MRLGFSPAARQDLRDIGDYIARANRTRARTFVAELRAQSAKAAENPEGYTTFPGPSGPLGRAVHGAYNIYFSILPTGIRIERIINAALDATPGQFDR